MALLNLKRDPFLIFFFVCLLTLLIILIACLFLLKHLSDLQIKSADERYSSYQVATGLRQSSEDLYKNDSPVCHHRGTKIPRIF